MCAIPISVVHMYTHHQDVKTNAAAAAEIAAAVQSLEGSPPHYETVVNVTVAEGTALSHRHLLNTMNLTVVP